MDKNDQDRVPLQPLNEIIKKFNRRKQIMDLLMLISMPSALVAIVFFAAFAFISNSPVSIITFILLVISAIASYFAVLYIPGVLTNIIKSLELTVRGISFTLSTPVGSTPAERILNQLRRTDPRTKNLLEKNPSYAKMNIAMKGKSGIDHSFDVCIIGRSRYGRFFGDLTSMIIFVKRFDEIDPVSLNTVKNLKAEVQDCLSGMNRRFPTRVLAVSTSGFDDSVFEYIRSKEGSFVSRYPPIRRPIEIIQEKVDGKYDVLSL